MREHQIEDQQVVIRCRGDIQSFRAIVGHVHDVPLLLKGTANQIRQSPFIFDD
jgi:hypothetical protein